MHLRYLTAICQSLWSLCNKNQSSAHVGYINFLYVNEKVFKIFTQSPVVHKRPIGELRYFQLQCECYFPTEMNVDNVSQGQTLPALYYR